MTYCRMVAAALIGICLGLSVSWFVGSLPDPIGITVCYLLLACVLVWAIRQWLWGRRMLREIREEMREWE